MKSDKNGDRITPAQNAAKAFASVVLGEGANTQNRIAVVSYADEAKRNIDLSSDLDTVKDAINFSAYGGTNIQAGIKAARDILQSSRADNKVILVLSDGEPTYSFRAVGTATSR
jgi:Mg-chelatase subunit ChlD